MDNEKVVKLLERFCNRREDDLQIHKAAKNNTGQVFAETDIEEINRAIKFLKSK